MKKGHIYYIKCLKCNHKLSKYIKKIRKGKNKVRVFKCLKCKELFTEIKPNKKFKKIKKEIEIEESNAKYFNNPYPNKITIGDILKKKV